MVKEPLTKSVSVEELRHMREVEGLTNKEIAKRLDVSATTVGKYLGPADPDWRARAAKLGGMTRGCPQKTVDEIRRLYSEGCSISGIQDRVHVSWETVKKYTKDLGPNRKKKKKAVTQQTAQMETPVVSAAAAPVTTARTPVCTILSSRRTVKLQGLECQYEVETDGKTGTLTVTNGTSEVAIFDAGSLDAFIAELTMIRNDYLSEVSA